MNSAEIAQLMPWSREAEATSPPVPAKKYSPTRAGRAEARADEAENARKQAIVMMAARHRVATQYKALAVEAVEILRLVVKSTEIRPKPGVYFLMGSEGEILYVGKSDNVLVRMAGHKEKDFETVKMIHVPRSEDRDKLEARLIHLLTPPLNIHLLTFNTTQVLLHADGFDGLPALNTSELWRSPDE